MLNKKAKIILNTLIINGFDKRSCKFTSIEKTLLPLLPNPDKYKWTFENVSPVLEYLYEKGLIDGVSFVHGYYPVIDFRDVFVTYIGTQYNLLTFRDNFRFWLPIVISIIALVISGLGLILK